MKTQHLIMVLLAVFLAACAGVVPSPPDATEKQPAIPTIASETAESQPTPTDSRDEATSPHPVEELIASFTTPPQTDGNALILYGQVLDVNGEPIPDAVVEIWQTDTSGIYDHPGDAKTNDRDMSFQFFGTALVGMDGWYAFRTILPGQYEPRPRHIHFKVKLNDETLLTSQFYFSEDIAALEGERMFQAVGDSGEVLLLQLVESDGVLLANGQIIVDTGIGSGTLPPTPSQGQGPFYPVVPVDEFDNDLLTLP